MQAPGTKKKERRVLAAREAGLTEMVAHVRPGRQRDAVFFGIGANGAHRLPRSNADKRHAVALVLADPEWSQRPGDWPALPGVSGGSQHGEANLRGAHLLN